VEKNEVDCSATKLVDSVPTIEDLSKDLVLDKKVSLEALVNNSFGELSQSQFIENASYFLLVAPRDFKDLSKDLALQLQRMRLKLDSSAMMLVDSVPPSKNLSKDLALVNKVGLLRGVEVSVYNSLGQLSQLIGNASYFPLVAPKDFKVLSPEAAGSEIGFSVQEELVYLDPFSFALILPDPILSATVFTSKEFVAANKIDWCPRT
jgi:hypothetical protein